MDSIGLFFGSFNPIHQGHLIIASRIKELANLKEVWLIISPQNPFKSEETLLHEKCRLELIQQAIENDESLKASDIEFTMQRPNYTIDTLRKLQSQYPKNHFKIILGQDNLNLLTKWKEYTNIIANFELLIYPRKHAKVTSITHQNIHLIDAPEIEISSSMIRQLLRDQKSIKYIVPDVVETIIHEKQYYQN